MSLVYPQKVTLYQVGDYLESASFNNFLDALDGSYCTYMGGDDPTQDSVYPDPGTGYGVYKGPENCGGFAATNVISTSYGYNEADLTPFYENRQCHEYMKLGLQGVTFLYSSGDYGVAGGGGQCIDTATGTFNNGSSGMFNPTFPGGCPCKSSLLGVPSWLLNIFRCHLCRCNSSQTWRQCHPTRRSCRERHLLRRWLLQRLFPPLLPGFRCQDILR
jgi:tripeptidyl-peptidase I